MGPVSDDVDGRSAGAAAAIARIIPTVPRSSSDRARTAALACPAGWSTRLRGAADEQLRGRRLGPGFHASARGGSASSPNITDIRSVAATPSTMQWWTFDRSAHRPSSSPSTIHSSHSGLERSRCWEKTRAAVDRSWSSDPGLGIALCRTW